MLRRSIVVGLHWDLWLFLLQPRSVKAQPLRDPWLTLLWDIRTSFTHLIILPWSLSIKYLDLQLCLYLHTPQPCLPPGTATIGITSFRLHAIKGRLGNSKVTLHDTFIGASWMGVMHEGSTIGFGLFAVSASKLCHCWGSPVNFCSWWSKPVWTRCSKLEGPEISSLFFFFPNMVEKSGEVTGKQKRKGKEKGKKGEGEKTQHLYALLQPATILSTA